MPFRCGGKEFISLIAALHHHHQRRQFVVALPPYVFSLRLDLFVNLKLTSSPLHAFNEGDAGLKLETEVGETVVIFSAEASGLLPAQLLWLLAQFKVIRECGKAEKCRRSAFFKEAQLVAAIREKKQSAFQPSRWR